MGKGGGGGYDTSGLEAATNKSIALQKEIYDQTRQDVQPWYNLGTGAVNSLQNLLGLAPSVQTAAQIRQGLAPSYTTQPSAGVTGTGIYSPTEILNAGSDNPDYKRYIDALNMYNSGMRSNYINEIMSVGKSLNLFKEGEAQPIVDTSGLDAATQAELQRQQEAAMNAPQQAGFGSLLKSFGMEDYQADPGYQFRQQEAQKALERQMAAQGITLGGGGAGTINPQAYRAMNELTQNLASQEYSSAYQRYTADNLNKFNMLMGAAGMGQGSTGILAGAGQNYATGTSQALTDLASAQQNAALAQASRPSMFGQLLGAGAQLGAAYLASDFNVKENIEPAGQENGYPIYKFNYKNDAQKYIGVMAQDVEKITPEAVVEIDGVKHVNYDMIGVQMRAV